MKAYKSIIAVITALLISCSSSVDEYHGHDHHESHAHEELEKPTVAHTVWTEKTELFVEFPALIVGQKSRFAAHFTMMDKHQPVKEGTVTVSLIGKGSILSDTITTPSSVGIFLPTLQPNETGFYQLAFEVKTPTLTDTIIIDSVQVFASTKEALASVKDEDELGNTISFLKEQAWRIDFQTHIAKEDTIYETIYTSGTWKEAPSDIKNIVATSSGIVTYTKVNLTEGTMVQKGQVLLRISNNELTKNNQSKEIKKAKINLEQAKLAYDRKKQLYISKVIPKADFEEVEQKYELAKSNYNATSNGYSNGTKQVIAPFNGFVKFIAIQNGSFVEEGSPLLLLSAKESSLLEIDISPQYDSKLHDIHDIWYQTQKGVWSNLVKKKGKVLSVTKSVTPTQPLLKVYAQVNDAVEMPEGSFTVAQILIGTAEKGLTIPTNALLEDYGAYSVIVQLSGETFERRPVSIGKTNGDYIEIIEGLTAEEVVVTEGAYQVKMASMSGDVPAHGHAH